MKFFSRKKKAAEKQESPKYKFKFKIGIAFSGGGARGFAHLGAIRAFEEAGIRFDYVAGTSVGSIAGALYAAGYSYEQMYEFAKTLTVKEIRNSKLFWVPSRTENIANAVRRFAGDLTFRDLKLPFACCAVDLNTGNEIVLTEGDVSKAVSASSAVPLIFQPVEWGEYRLVDGGLQNTIPADVVRGMGAEFVVSVDLNSARGSGTVTNKLLDVAWATFNIAMKNSALKGAMNTDLMIYPDLTAFSATKPDGMEQMIEEGYRATKEAIPQLLYAVGAIKNLPQTQPKTEA